jgi:hypothetical protein
MIFSFFELMSVVHVQDGHGKQALSVRQNAPSYGVGSELRKGLATKSIVPGPGGYKVSHLQRNFHPQLSSYACYLTLQ